MATSKGQPRPFDWTVDDAVTWPPRGRKRAPFGPTEVEVIRSCPLRSCFEYSQGYERRQDFRARIGTAFHLTLQSLDRDPLLDLTPRAVAAEARKRFDDELAKQSAQADARPRERGLPREEGRADSARAAIMAEAWRLAEQGFLHEAAGLVEAAEELQLWTGEAPVRGMWVETEVLVKSGDGLFQGRVDRAEHSPDGTRLVDVKSAVRTDLPERYERQLQLYALMWRDTRGALPRGAAVVYPFTGREIGVRIDEQTCERLAAESASVAELLMRERNAERLATPGDVCKVCEFRPWCRPFWNWQAGEMSRIEALDRAALGFEGRVEAIQMVNGQWLLMVGWRGVGVRIVAPEARFPQLAEANVGTRVRALDTRLQGIPTQPQGQIGDYSEIWLVKGHPGAGDG